MNDVLLAAMIAAFVLLPASVVLRRQAEAAPEEPHDPADCRHCAVQRHPSRCGARTVLARFPKQAGGEGR